jgi:addiction module HigA family antidote
MMKNPFHPGEILSEEFLKPGDTTQTAFSKKIGWTRPKLNAFSKGKHGVTADSALDLAEATGTTPKFWMNLQATWDLALALKKCKAA